MRKSLTITIASLVILFGASAFLTACNTIEGAGKDVAHVGSEVSEEANAHK